MVIRSFLLPNAEEDKNEDIKRWRESLFNLSASQHADPSATTSILADLPVKKARNSYSLVDETGVQFKDGEDGSRRSYHRFGFQFFRISTEHVNAINAIMLDNAHANELIAFASRDALKETLEHYITLPSDRGFKVVSDETKDFRVQYLRKLEQVLRKLGSNGCLVYRSLSIPDQEQQLVMMGQELVKHLPEQPTEYMRLHLKLGKMLEAKST